MQNKTISLLVLSSIFLAGCSGEPSQGDIEAAVAKQQQGVPKEVQGLVPEIKNVKKIGCKTDGEKAYICDIEMEVAQMGRTNKGVVPIRLVKASDGWMASMTQGQQ